MKFTRYQYNSLIAVICAMVLGLIVMAFVYAYEFELVLVTEDSCEEESTESENTVLDAPTSSVPEECDTFYQGTTSTDQIEDLECQPPSGEGISSAEAELMVYEEEDPWYTSDYELLARLVWAEARGRKL